MGRGYHMVLTGSVWLLLGLCCCYSGCYGIYVAITGSMWLLWGLYRVSHKKRNGGFSVHCEQKVVNIFTSLYKVSSAEENDT